MLELVNYDNQDIEQELVCDGATPGLMCCDDKKKLDGIQDGANKYIHPGYTARTSGLYKITVDGNGHVSSVTAVTKADITALGIPGQDTNTTYGDATTSARGLMTAAMVTKLNGIADGANKFTYTHPGTHPASMITQDSTHRFVSDTEKNTWNGKADGSHAHSWSSITGKPSSFTPTGHDHNKLILYGTNTVPNDSTQWDNVANWASKGHSIHWYTRALLNGQPSQYGFLMNIAYGSDTHQLWLTQSDGNICHRAGNASTTWNASSWNVLLDTRNYTSYVVPKSGGTFTGALTVNGTINAYNGINVGDNKNILASYYLSRGNNAAGIQMMGTTSWAAVAAWEDNSCAIGYSTNRFTRLYAVSGTINTSDELEKDILPEGITKKYEDLFMKLEPILYKWKNEEKVIKKNINGEEKEYIINNNHDRIHCGLGARTTEKHANEVGLDTMSFAAICKDKLEEPTEDGRTERYGIAYEELHGLEIHMIQKVIKENAELKSKNAELEERLEILEALLLK